MEHHKYQGDETVDVDLPTEAEGRVFRSAPMKLLFVFLMPAFYSLRCAPPLSPLLSVLPFLSRLPFSEGPPSRPCQCHHPLPTTHPTPTPSQPRPLFVRPKKPSDWEIANVTAQVTFDLLVLFLLGPKALVYLVVGTLLGTWRFCAWCGCVCGGVSMLDRRAESFLSYNNSPQTTI